MKLKKIKKVILEKELIKISSFYDEAIIGFENKTNKCIYSIKKILKILITKNKISKKEAIDFYFENIYSDENNKPIFSDDFLNYDKDN